jgi:3-hydroxyethyl bacteriochlorophyllide a dehydrogenase
VLLALAATAQHAIAGSTAPELIVGHGVLGRLLARLAVLAGGEPTVWERNPERAAGAVGYRVLDPAADPRRDYATVCDVSGDPAILDTLVARLAPGGEIVLAGFYAEPLAFAFPPAFMREARIRVAAQWRDEDLATARALIESGRLSLDGLITHARRADEADAAYRTAFGDPACLKMILDWRAGP